MTFCELIQSFNFKRMNNKERVNKTTRGKKVFDINASLSLLLMSVFCAL